MDSTLDSFFFLLCPHGVGTVSFIYYLNLIGATSCHHHLNTYRDGKLINPRYPIQKAKLYTRGVSLDRVILDSKPLFYGDNKQKIIQIKNVPEKVEQWTHFHSLW